jgi:hypothetical protein
MPWSLELKNLISELVEVGSEQKVTLKALLWCHALHEWRSYIRRAGISSQGWMEVSS